MDAQDDGIEDMGHGQDLGGPGSSCYGYWRSVRCEMAYGFKGVVIFGAWVHTQTLAIW